MHFPLFAGNASYFFIQLFIHKNLKNFQNKKRITILGSTGSIGTQTLEVIGLHKEKLEVNFLTTNQNIELLEKQCAKFSPKGVVISEEKSYQQFVRKTNFKGKILCGEDGVIEASSDKNCDLVLVALVGFSGVLPTLKAIENGKNIALANKETLVTAGKIITTVAQKNNVSILPIDSEHSAIFQCLDTNSHNGHMLYAPTVQHRRGIWLSQNEIKSEVEKVILTASGGPFLNTPNEKLAKISADEALKHPTWKMGHKVTIDSATMMNKGFEVIEAYWLFGFELKQIEVVVHPQSVIHSMVQYFDGSMLAQLGCPDMRIPIQYALFYPQRLQNNFPRIDFKELNRLDFFEPDFEKFQCLKIAYEAIEKGGNASTVVNAANEIAVSAFINNQIKFTDIPKYIFKALENIPFIPEPNLDEIIQTDFETRKFVTN